MYSTRVTQDCIEKLEAQFRFSLVRFEIGRVEDFAAHLQKLQKPDGTMARSNGDLVAKAVALTRDVGREPATLDEARHMLNLA